MRQCKLLVSPESIHGEMHSCHGLAILVKLSIKDKAAILITTLVVKNKPRLISSGLELTTINNRLRKPIAIGKHHFTTAIRHDDIDALNINFRKACFSGRCGTGQQNGTHRHSEDTRIDNQEFLCALRHG